MVEQAKEPFRVVVVGAGVTGLTASHALQKAGIDHVVLEKGNDAAPSLGASIAIYPHGSRLLEQFVASNDLWKVVRENHGYEILLMERHIFLDVLYNGLPDKSRIVMNKSVESIREDENGVEVFCHDGTSERGDIVIGCDGVHSKVRQTMWEHAAKLQPSLITAQEKKTMTTTWNCLVGVDPGEPDLDHEIGAVHNNGYSFLVSAQPDKTYWFAFRRATKPYSTYRRPRYTEKDAEEATVSMAEQPISRTKLFGELWRNKWRSALVDVEEGVLDNWHFGRTVLMTPNIALGGNTGMESVALLMNLLNRELRAHHGTKPSKDGLSVVFQEFQEKQRPRALKIMKFANSITRVQAWDGFLMKMMALRVMPFRSDESLGRDLSDIIKGAAKLDFVPISKYNERKVLWDNEEQLQRPTRTEMASSLVKQAQVPMLILLIALFSAVWLMRRSALLLWQ
ncbi:MAG: hypothetical protein M1822_009076 [Bathelium mastoideum]|nr:MAG: hypothetical protein M1822_009076 [Bathelium mastoideum]